MTSALCSRAAIVAEHWDRGTRLTTLRSDPPVALRPAAGAVYLAASGAGPLGGDQVHLEMAVGPAAELEVRSVSASLVLPGPRPGRSESTTVVSVGAGGELRWLTEPTVAVRGCDHHGRSRIELAESARLVWREELVLGRSDEASGSVLQRLTIDRAGRPLLRTEHAVGPLWPGSTGPAGTGGRRALGTLTVVGPLARDVKPPAGDGGTRAALLELGEDAVMVTAVATTARALRAVLDQALLDLRSGGAA